MNSVNLFFSAVQFLFAVLVIFLGGFLVGIEHSPHMRFALADFFAESTASFAILGYGIVVLGLALLGLFCFIHRGSYYQVKMGSEVDPAVIQGYASEYWKRVFPEHQLEVQVSLNKDQKIEMFVELPPIAEEKQVLENAERELARVLRQKLGYRKDFLLSVLIK